MRAWLLALVVIVSMLLAGCGGRKNADATEASDPFPGASDEAAERPGRGLPYNHTESFTQEGNAFIGTRGYSRVCGGLAENGVGG